MSIRHPTAAVEIRLYCARCGRPYYSGECKHQGTMTATMSDAEALRVQARYALGKRSNPDHDETSYRDAAIADVEQARDALMTSKITIEVPPHDYAVRVGIEHENLADVEIKHVGPSETWSAYIYNGMRIIEISEVKLGDIKVGRTHTGKLGAPVLVQDDPDFGKLRQSGVL